jgi:hypothetical protein
VRPEQRCWARRARLREARIEPLTSASTTSLTFTALDVVSPSLAPASVH